MLSSRLTLGGLFVALFAAGCGGGGRPADPPKQATVPASGVVRYQGKPVANASVNFQALDGKVSAYGQTDAAGTFKFEGVPPGTYAAKSSRRISTSRL